MSEDVKDARWSKTRIVKCVVWDLDNTLWHGTLLEDAEVVLREGIQKIISTLDQRGILQSIASKNDAHLALTKLQELDLDKYFLYPQINWNSKVVSLQSIATALNIGFDALAFVDDQPSERAEISFSLPDILCIDAVHIHDMLVIPALLPRFITEDATIRRKMYQNDIERQQAEELFVGSKEEFLATLDLSLTIAPAKEEDLQRLEELTVRTNQLNTTGYTYSYKELEQLCQSPDHLLLVATLKDRYGMYGKIGLALVECTGPIWTIKLLLMSCRVMSKGVGTIMINYIMQLARKAAVELRAEFVSNMRNRMMYVTYKFAGFKEFKKFDYLSILSNDLSSVQPFPVYVKVYIQG